jgi:phage gp36-like protein
MTYSNTQILSQRFGEDELKTLTDRDGSNALNVQILENALNDADALINSALKHRYSVPFSPVPTIIKLIATDIAYSRLFTHHRPPIVSEILNDAMKQLSDIASGNFNINDVPSKASNLAVDSDTKIFGRKPLTSF